MGGLAGLLEQIHERAADVEGMGAGALIAPDFWSHRIRQLQVELAEVLDRGSPAATNCARLGDKWDAAVKDYLDLLTILKGKLCIGPSGRSAPPR
jgi:hypothetical protein